MRNTWVTVNSEKLAKMKLFLTECEYKPEYDKFPIREVQLLLNGLEAEVNKLYNETVALKRASVKKEDSAKKEA